MAAAYLAHTICMRRICICYVGQMQDRCTTYDHDMSVGPSGARGGKDASHPISDLASPLKGGEATLRFGDFLNLIIIMALLI